MKTLIMILITALSLSLVSCEITDSNVEHFDTNCCKVLTSQIDPIDETEYLIYVYKWIDWKICNAQTFINYVKVDKSYCN